jgi:predicted nucleotidyltransferase
MLRKKSYGSVEVVSLDREQLLAELIKIARRMKEIDPGIVAVRLFGSLARGDYTPESDVDIVVFHQGTSLPFLKRADGYRDLFLPLPLDVDIKVYTRKEAAAMREQNSAFIREVLETGAVLFGDDQEQQNQ